MRDTGRRKDRRAFLRILIAVLVLPPETLAAVGILTVMPGRSTLLQAAVHLVLCVAFLFLAANP